jgi:hypothetical protein
MKIDLLASIFVVAIICLGLWGLPQYNVILSVWTARRNWLMLNIANALPSKQQRQS